MPRYQYRARSSDGEQITGTMEGESQAAVAQQLSANALIPVSIQQVSDSGGQAGGFSLSRWWALRQAVKLEDLILFCRQMYTLTRAGVPMNRALRGLVESTSQLRLAETLEEVAEELESGRELAGAMAAYPKVFPPLVSRMVQVGENTGCLDESFMVLANYLERERDTRQRVKSALRYPTFVIVAIGIAIAVLTLFVIPAFAKVFSSFGEQLPLPTRIILGISDFAVAYWPHILVGMLGLTYGVRRFIKTKQGRYIWNRWQLRLPVVGSILTRTVLARFARTFGMGYANGVPMHQALGLTSQAVDNAYIADKVDQMRDALERGETMTRSAASTGMFTPLVLQMLSVGEESGAVDELLSEVAEFYEREVDYELKNITSAIEPILIIIIGAMVLVLALGVFLPMWNLASVATG